MIGLAGASEVIGVVKEEREFRRMALVARDAGVEMVDVCVIKIVPLGQESWHIITTHGSALVERGEVIILEGSLGKETRLLREAETLRAQLPEVPEFPVGSQDEETPLFGPFQEWPGAAYLALQELFWGSRVCSF